MFLAQAEDFGAILFWLLFVILPILSRVIQKVVAKSRDSAEDGSAPPAGRRRAASRDAMADDAEADGEDLWRRLLEGDAPAEGSEVVRPSAPTASATGVEGRARDAMPSAATRRPAPVPAQVEPLPQTLIEFEGLEDIAQVPSLASTSPNLEGGRYEEGAVEARGVEWSREAMAVVDDASWASVLDARAVLDRRELSNAMLWSFVLAPPRGLEPHADPWT